MKKDVPASDIKIDLYFERPQTLFMYDVSQLRGAFIARRVVNFALPHAKFQRYRLEYQYILALIS